LLVLPAPATPGIYTLSLHDALPICLPTALHALVPLAFRLRPLERGAGRRPRRRAGRAGRAGRRHAARRGGRLAEGAEDERLTGRKSPIETHRHRLTPPRLLAVGEAWER